MAKTSLYDHYYSSSDVIISLSFPPSNKTVILDKALGLGFSQSMTSMPIYTLGKVEPTFFSRGNTLIQGNLDLAFKSSNYMKAAMNYISDATGTQEELRKLRVKMSNNEEPVTKEEVIKYSLLESSSSTSLESTSISEILNLFDIIIDFNNENATMAGTGSHKIVLEGVKFIGEAMSIHSADQNALVDRYTFMAKNKG